MVRRSLAQTTLTYGFLHRINRVFGDRHAQGKWKSGRVLHASYGDFAATRWRVRHLLFETLPPTPVPPGGSFNGSAALPDQTLYRAEAAPERHGSGLNYEASYLAIEAGLGFKPGSVALGYEVLGQDNNVGFKTPLATLHAFNGWADLFLTTPAAGLRDAYVKGTANLPGGIAFLAYYHRFTLDRTGADVGTEFNAQLSRKFGKTLTGAAKLADFRREGPAYPDVRKVWLQIEFVY